MDWGLSLSLLNKDLIWTGLLIALIYLVTMVLSSLSFMILLKHQHEHLAFKDAFTIVILGQFISFFAPLKTGTLVGKPLLTKLLTKVPLRKTFSALTFESFMGLAWQLATLPIMLIILGEKILLISTAAKWVIIFFLVLIFGLVSHKHHWFIPNILKLKFLVPQKIRKLVSRLGLTEEAIKETIDSLPAYFQSTPILTRIILILTIQAFFLPLYLGVLLWHFNISLPYLTIFALYWVSYIFGRLSILPAGLGVKDITLGGFLIGVGVGTTMSVQIVILFRILTLLPVLILGGIFFIIYGKTINDKKKESALTS